MCSCTDVIGKVVVECIYLFFQFTNILCFLFIISYLSLFVYLPRSLYNFRGDEDRFVTFTQGPSGRFWWASSHVVQHEERNLIFWILNLHDMHIKLCLGLGNTLPPLGLGAVLQSGFPAAVSWPPLVMVSGWLRSEPNTEKEGRRMKGKKTHTQ